MTAATLTIEIVMMTDDGNDDGDGDNRGHVVRKVNDGCGSGGNGGGQRDNDGVDASNGRIDGEDIDDGRGGLCDYGCDFPSNRILSHYTAPLCAMLKRLLVSIDNYSLWALDSHTSHGVSA